MPCLSLYYLLPPLEISTSFQSAWHLEGVEYGEQMSRNNHAPSAGLGEELPLYPVVCDKQASLAAASGAQSVPA